MNEKNQLTTADILSSTILADKNLSSDMKSAAFFGQPTFVRRLSTCTSFVGGHRWKAAA